jgi:glyoxylase-like metal-dependent hydrolase (beta-lactamase superfamily II)
MGGPGGWEQDVASIACETDDAFVVIDPLLPPDDDATRRFLDQRGHQRAVEVLLTASWHERDTALLRRRYGAAVWASAAATRSLSCEVANTIRAAGTVLGGIVALPLGGIDEGEVAYYLSDYKALVVAEVFIGTEAGLRVCVPPALRSLPEWDGSVKRLLEREINMVLPAHGPPVLSDGRDSIVQALAKPDWNSERGQAGS